MEENINWKKMTKNNLKTLKDIKINHPTERGFRRELKAEAVKCIKIFEFGTPSGLQPMDSKTRAWIKHFFNLTEEDLKCK